MREHYDYHSGLEMVKEEIKQGEELRKRSMDEMISYFNQRVSEMNISAEDKMTILGLITAIGFKYEEDTKAVQTNNQVHLCDSCSYTYPECPSVYTDVIFGNGIGNDNICACSKYLPSAQPEPFGTIKHAGAEHPLSDEEIIPRLRQIQEQVGGSYAIDRAIELLTAQTVPCEDAVSRRETLDLVRDVCTEILSGCKSHYDGDDEVYDDMLEVDAILKCNKEIRKAISNMPSVTPKQSLDIDKVSEEVFNAISKWLTDLDDKRDALDVIKDVLRSYKGKE